MASQLANILTQYGQTTDPGRGLREGVQGGIQNYFAAKQFKAEKAQASKEAELTDIKTESANIELFKQQFGGAISAADTQDKWNSAVSSGFIPKGMEFNNREPFIMGIMQDESIKQQEIKLKTEAGELRKLEHGAKTEERKLKRETNILQREELELKIEDRQRSARQKRIDLNISTRAQIRAQNSLSTAIDTFMENKDYVSAVTGYRGRTPSMTTTGLEAESYFDNIKNNLTLENLDKMTGVLSETDIKILSTAATALTLGMSKKAMTREMNKIKDVLATKTDEVQQKLLGDDTQAATQAGGQPQEGDTANNPQTGERLIFTNGQWQSAP